MPIHDWTRAEDGDFHHFHQRWISALTDALNGVTLPRLRRCKLTLEWSPTTQNSPPSPRSKRSWAKSSRQPRLEQPDTLVLNTGTRVSRQQALQGNGSRPEPDRFGKVMRE